MPTYEYECNACGHTYEEFQNITAKLRRKCPKCGKLRLRRLIGSGGAILFKGSGFYQTDYRSKEYTDQAKADTKPSCETSSCPASKTCPHAKKSD